jgi:hypothetical protein
MPSRIALTSLNARTIDIINTIRANASPQYQHLVPEIEKETDIPAIGQTLLGYPQMANEFISTLVNRIASVEVKSAMFNNPYADLKKGFLELGETVEEVFVSIAKAREFNVEKAPAREFKRTLPDVRTAFHTMNWRVQYPVTIQRNDLERAFLSVSGVTDMIARIVDTLYNGANYDEYLLFKYLLIKAISSGKAKPIAVDTTDAKDFGIKARATSNKLTFMSNEYNNAGVTTVTDKSDQYIFIDADWEAQYDVEVLASAFNMDKADYIGRRKLIDNWATFDNDRFSIIRENSTMIDEITDAELTLMGDVKAVLVDREWFQVYDNLSEFSEKFVASGLYWNYFYNVWKTISFSPFSNIAVFVDDSATITPPASIKYNVTAVSTSDNATIVTLELDDSTASLAHSSFIFVQTEDATTDGVAVHKYGAIILPEGKDYDAVLSVDGTLYEGDVAIDATTAVGDVITFTPAT